LKVTIDKYSGFCFGVVYAIEMAEAELSESGKLYCLGDIVHNNIVFPIQKVPLLPFQ
jgi:4-hydroxy-3-methylbut-2-enyl diphosphate reductase